ncbi:MAG TPA: VOC family protein [Microlunatus sp.]|nr:VOC family protein [Microlunatus sp.]
MFSGLQPILSSTDLDRLVAFYTGGLDAEIRYSFPDDGPAAFVSLEIGGGTLGIARDADAADPAVVQRHALWLYADDCDEATNRLVGLGATLVTPPADMPWGERVADLTDPDGNRLHVAHQLG